MKEYIVQAIAQETIDSFDAHNAPELIRCKDCKHFDCGRLYKCRIHGYLFQPKNADWFCADGERKEGR